MVGTEGIGPLKPLVVVGDVAGPGTVEVVGLGKVVVAVELAGRADVVLVVGETAGGRAVETELGAGKA